jgi:hypothetical protein
METVLDAPEVVDEPEPDADGAEIPMLTKFAEVDADPVALPS